MHEKKNDIVECATAFAVASAGVLFLALVPGALGIRQTQKAQAFNLIADGYRKSSLAKTYDTKAAAVAAKTMMKKVL